MAYKHIVWSPSASNGGRTSACPAWAALTYVHREEIETKEMPWSVDGTAAHRVLELMLTGQQATSKKDDAYAERLRATNEKEQHYNAIYFANHKIRHLIHEIRQLDPNMIVEYEQALPIFSDPKYKGTVDILIISLTRVVVIDYKHGAGIPVNVKGNLQLKAYLFAAIARIRKLRPDIDASKLHYDAVIIQPRCTSVEPLQEVRYSFAEIMSSMAALRERVRVSHTLLAGAKRGALPAIEFFAKNDGCQFCPSRIFCPAWLKPTKELAERYRRDTDATRSGYPRVNQETLEKLYIDALGIDGYLAKIRDYIAARIAQGRGAGYIKAIPGYQKRHVKEGALALLKKARKKKRISKKQYDECVRQIPQTITALHSILPTKIFSQLIETRQTRPTLVPSTDPRPDTHAETVAKFRSKPRPNKVT